jgi:hypothetical protein
VALGCRAAGDEDTALWELQAARAMFDRLGAGPDVARVDSLAPRCCVSSPGARPTSPSPPSSCSANGRSTGT